MTDTPFVKDEELVRKAIATTYQQDGQYFVRVTIRTDTGFKCYNIPLGLAAEFGLSIILAAGQSSTLRSINNKRTKNEGPKN